MLTQILHNMTKSYLRLGIASYSTVISLGAAAVCFGTLSSAPAWADPLRTTVFFGAADEMKDLNLKPVHLMDDKTLFLTAQQIRDQSMSIEHRYLNHIWLQKHAGNRENKSRIATHLWKKLSLATVNKRPNTPQHESVEDLLGTGLVSQFGRYKLRLSDKSVLLKFQKNFE